MTERQIEILLPFIYRMPLYLGKESKENITVFMHGFESGSDSKYWTETLRNLLFEKYEIERVNSGWPYEIGVYAERESTSWIEAFKKLMIEIIMSSESYNPKLKELHELLKEWKNS